MEIFEYTDKGGREKNEDYVAHRIIDDTHSVFVVADGMGGLHFGEVAAKTVAEAVVKEATLSVLHKPYVTQEEVIRFAIDDADGILERTRLGLGGHEMGTVVAALYINGLEGYIASVGDCRVYHYRGSQMLFRSQVDSFLNRSDTAITAKQLRTHTAAVVRGLFGDSLNPIGAIKPTKIDLLPGDTLLLCSDGIHKETNVERFLTPTSNELISMLNEEASCFSDNISIIRVRI